MPLSARSLALALSLAGLASLAGCANSDSRFDRSSLDDPDAGVVLGEFPLAKNAIIDGDTIKVDGLDASLRLLAIDTEETFKYDKEWRAFEVGWEAYLEAEQAKTSRPIKIATPLGMDAKYWAEDFFAGVTRVRLERDHPKEVRGRFNRFLVYVLVERNGEWVNYNIECVRAGMSPYFTKYGYSRRFHAEFVAAEQEARAAGLGIWAEGAQAYQDYDLRKRWWDARADFVAEFEADARDDPSLIALTNWDSLDRIADRLGDEVELLGTVGDIRQGERGPKRVLLSRRLFSDFPLIFWDNDVFEDSGIARYRGEFVRVRGVVTRYTDRRTGKPQLQIEVRDPAQVRLPRYIPPGDPEDDDPDLEGHEDRDAVEAPDDFSQPDFSPPDFSPPDEREPTPSERRDDEVKIQRPGEPEPDEPEPGPEAAPSPQ
jgi:endonuclease YncB( thermonuclease family)